MVKIGNIIYENSLVNHTKVDFINYYDTAVAYDTLSLPTLYVGWESLKRFNPENSLIQSQSILDKSIIDNKLLWEFSFKENKSKHVLGVEMFVNNLPHFYFSEQFNYINYDPIFYEVLSISDIEEFLSDKIDCVYNYKNEMLYMLLGNYVYGLDIEMYEYFGFDVNEIISLISKKTDKYFMDSDGEIYQEYYKIFPTYDYLKRYIVTLLHSR